MIRNPIAIVVVGTFAIALAFGYEFYLGEEEASNEVSSRPSQPTKSFETNKHKQIETTLNSHTTKNQNVNNNSPQEQVAQDTPQELLPSFDIVRVDKEGNAVIAGRAGPGEKVTIIDNGKEVATAIADNRGQWVSVTKTHTIPGIRQLTLESVTKGAPPKKSEAPLILLVPPNNNKNSANQDNKNSPVIALTSPKKGLPSKLLQKPPTKTKYKLTIDTIDYDEKGVLIISGHAPSAGSIFVYLDDSFIGSAKPDSENIWLLRPKNPITPGKYNLRVDQIDSKGKVMSRISTPFSRANPDKGLSSEPFIVVQHGNSLWRLAARNYGSGFRYTIILNANLDQIKDPDLIYPGQVFALPSPN